MQYIMNAHYYSIIVEGFYPGRGGGGGFHPKLSGFHPKTFYNCGAKLPYLN